MDSLDQEATHKRRVEILLYAKRQLAWKNVLTADERRELKRLDILVDAELNGITPWDREDEIKLTEEQLARKMELAKEIFAALKAEGKW